MKCIHADSTDPPSCIKQNPKSIMERLASLSLPKEAPPHYKQNLVSCGCKEKLTCK